MKQYIERRGEWVDRTLLADPLPPTPTIAAKDQFDLSSPQLNLQLTPLESRGKVRWRLAEISDPASRGGKAKQPMKNEIKALWEADGGVTGEIPTKDLKNGHTYRIRARVQDDHGRWSRWSAPIQFTATRAK